MPIPQLPIAQGANLPSLERDEDVQEAIMQDDEIEHYEEVLDRKSTRLNSSHT